MKLPESGGVVRADGNMLDRVLIGPAGGAPATILTERVRDTRAAASSVTWEFP